MTFSNFLKVITKIKGIAEDNETSTCDLIVKIRTTSGQEIKAWFDEINFIDNEILEIFTDDSYKFLTYSNIESISI